MPVHIGIVGDSAEGAALCQRTMRVEGAVLLGTRPARRPALLDVRMLLTNRK